MKTSNLLVPLVQSLTPSEKRYVKLFCDQQSTRSANYLLLFDLAMICIDDKDLKTKAKEEKLDSHLSEGKYYLYKNILKALRLFRAGNSIDLTLHELLCNVEILIQKCLFKNAINELDKAETMAIKYNRHEPLVMIYFYKIRLFFSTNFSYTNDEGITGYIHDKKYNLDTLYELEKVKNLTLKTIRIRQTLGLPDNPKAKESYQKLEKVFDSIKINPNSFVLSHAFIESKILYNNYFYNNQKKNNKLCFEALVLLSEHPYMKETNLYLYTSILHNLALSEINLHNLHTAKFIIDEMNHYTNSLTHDLDNYYKSKRSLFSLMSYFYSIYPDFSVGNKYAKMMLSEINKLKNLDPYAKALIVGNCGQILFSSGDLQGANNCFNFVLNDKQETIILLKKEIGMMQCLLFIEENEIEFAKSLFYQNCNNINENTESKSTKWIYEFLFQLFKLKSTNQKKIY